MRKIEDYMRRMFNADGKLSSSAGFLGAYNLGVWGVSVSGNRSLDQGLLATGKVLTKKPREKKTGPLAKNYVKYYDTPSLWGYGDLASQSYDAIAYASKVLGISMSDGIDEDEWQRVKSYLKVHFDLEEKPWSEIAKKVDVQKAINKEGAWSELVGRWRAVIGQSRYLVDVTSLSPPLSKTAAEDGICEGIKECLEQWLSVASKKKSKSPRLMIRLLFGMTAKSQSNWQGFLTRLQSTLGDFGTRIRKTGAKELPVVLYGSDMSSARSLSWGTFSTFNHSKIVAGDGQYAVVGGHNMCEEVSSNKAPVIHDVTCEVTGPGAKSANAFAGSLWLKAAENAALWIYNFDWKTGKFKDISKESSKKWAPKNFMSYSLGKQSKVPAVIENQYWYYPMATLPAVAELDPPSGSVPAAAVMGVGRWGDINVFGVDCSGGLKFGSDITAQRACQYAADFVKRLMINDPKNTTIRMSQQDLINDGPFSKVQSSQHVICELLGKRLRATPKGTAIQVVVSSRYTQNCDGLAYSYGDGPREAAERISDTVAGVSQQTSTPGSFPKRLEVLEISRSLGSADIRTITSSKDPSFCTIAPLTFCEARGATRSRGSYVWPDATYVWDRTYTSSRFWDKTADKRDRKFGPGNHSKVLYVSKGDNDATGLVLIGSDNMYPSPLSEFSFVIEGKQAVEKFRTQYWDRLWGYSARLGFTVNSDGSVE